MKFILIIAVSLTFGFWAGVTIEANTQALAVARIKSESYARVLSPLNRLGGD